jgi:hypothetical protein
MHIDGVLSYDSRLEDYDLQALKVKTALNKGGTATITMPPGHPAYSSFKAYKSIVEIRRDEKLKFRGRPLPPSEDFLNQRTVICEGEFCFLRDAQHRPYLYQDNPANIFSAVMGVYNSQADPEKQFKVGTVTVTDANDYVRLESENPETIQATVNKLLERCGGYIIFTTDSADGARVINWYADIGYRSSQVIEFGENLLDFSRDSSTNEELATAVLPYGAKDQETGQRLTIESVNGGLDYIVDAEARQLRGFILGTQTWDDVTDPANLLRKAQEWLSEKRNLVTALKLSALDLSYMDKRIDSYEVGDKIPVLSKPHSVDEDFMLTEKEEDMLNLKNGGSITLGKDKRTLTGADVAGDYNSLSQLHKVTHDIKVDYTANTAKVVQETELALRTLIQQTSDEIKLEVSRTYTTNDQLTAAVSSSMTQLEDQFLFEFNSLRSIMNSNDASTRGQFEEIHNYIRFENGNIILGGSDNNITLTIENDLIVFKRNGQRFGWWDGVDFHTGNIVVEVNERAQFGNFAFVPRSNGSLSFLKVN